MASYGEGGVKIEDFEKWQEAHWERNSDPYHNSLFYLAACAQGEAGEAFRIVKRACKKQLTDTPYLSKDEQGELVLEIGDTMHYCLRMLRHMGVSAEEALELNYQKLLERYGKDS